MPEPSVTPSRTHELLAAILEQLREDAEERRAQTLLLEQIANGTHVSRLPADDARAVALIVAVRDALEDWDLPFDSQELADRARQHHGLDQALRAYGCTDTYEIGCRLRAIAEAGHSAGGLVVVRDEKARAWRLAPRT